MNILIINTFYFPNIIGGTENSIKLLAEGLRKRGHNVAVYCIDNFGDGIKKEKINDVLIYRGNAGIFNLKARVNKNATFSQKLINRVIELSNYTALREYKYILEDFKPDIIHTNNLFGISPLIWKIGRKNNVKIVHTLRDYWIMSPLGYLENEKKYYWIKKLRLKFYRTYFIKRSNNVTAVTAPSDFTLNKFLESKYFYKSSIKKSINNSVDLNIDETKVLLKIKREKNNKLIKFLFVGSLYEIKGIKNLINAFSQVQNKNIMLYICGDGDLKDFVEESCNKDKRIIYKGKLNSKELKEAYIESDVLIVPSIWDEPFGRVVIEGNQFGLPVIASNKGGIPEIVKNIQGGELFNSDNLEDLKSKINKFTDREYIKIFYSNIENNINKYSLDYQIEKFIELYKNTDK